MQRRATRTGYTAHGVASVGETGTATGPYGAGFVSLQQVTATLDAADRTVADTATAGGTTYGVTQYGYDAAGRLECTARRMNGATWTALPSSACALGTAGSDGPDRIARTTYDPAGRPALVQSAYGTTDQADEASMSYNANGTIASATDANGNKTSYTYDGFDRLSETHYPATAAGSGSSSASDYEQLGYDAGGSVVFRRSRDGSSISYGYDALGRLTGIDLPNTTPDEFDKNYSYDLLGRLTHAVDGSTHFATLAYDALGRQVSEQSNFSTRYFGYDLAGRRTRLTWGDGFYASYDYDTLGEMIAVRDNGAASGPGVLATYGYDDLGRRTSLVRGNGTSTSYGYDGASRLTALSLDLAGTAYDESATFAYNAAGQIVSTTRSNDAYAFAGAANRDDGSGINGLNQVTSAGATSLSYDARGNLAANGGASYGYTSEDRLASGPGVTLAYDPLGRLHYDTADAPGEVLQYDGDRLVTEVSGGIDRRYVFGAGADEPLVEYDGSGNRTWLAADERGSVVARANDAGAATAINRYDEYGVPAGTNVGRFGYTGQAWLPSVGLWYYKARMYAPSLDRFLQTDPVGYGAGMNWYGYAGGDPVNATDPSGLAAQSTVGNAVNCKEVGEDLTHQCDIPITAGGINLFKYPVEWGYGPISYRPGNTGVVFDTPPSQPSSQDSKPSLPQIRQVAQIKTMMCMQSAANAAALDYSQPLYPGGTTTQQHIIDRHLSGIPNVSQYSTSGGFAAVERTNYYTYRFGIQTFTPTGLEFDLVHPLAALGFTTGTNRSGGDTYTNHLVVKFDCKTVITSYPR